MKPEHKQYILHNINQKSVKGIAQELGIKQRKIRKFLQRHRQKKRQVDAETQSKTILKKSTILVSLILIIALGFAVYINSINGEFVWDDEHLIDRNLYIKDWSHIHKIFTKDIRAGAGREGHCYRPFQMLTYMFDYSLWRLDVRGYHLTNILLHILVALSIFWLINILYDNWLLSLFTGMLFVAHPIHTEAVAYISGRADSLAALFMLLCLILYIKQIRSKGLSLYLLALLSYVLALLSRESSLIIPVLLILYHYCFKQRLKLGKLLPILGISFIYIVLRLTVLKSLLLNLPYSATLWQRTPGFFVAITSYLRLLFLPFNLHMEYGDITFGLTDPPAIGGLVILVSALFYAFKKR